MDNKTDEPIEKELSEKCLRHQITATDLYCRLCEAKKEAKGRIERAKKIFTLNDFFE